MPGPVPEKIADRLNLIRTEFRALPGWRADDPAPALAAFLKSCKRLLPQPGNRALGAGGTGGRIADWRPVCAAAASAGKDSTGARNFFEREFVPYRASSSRGEDGLFTGYYEAELKGSLVRHGPYKVPIYRRPPGLVTVDLGRFDAKLKGRQLTGQVRGGQVLPLATRAEIEGGALKGKGLELLWVDSAVDAFFLHVQGSGRVILDDGRVLRLGYAGRNGHAYTSIGRALIEQGTLSKENVSMQSIRAWIEANPDAGARLMASNPSYIFFSIKKGDGPIGAQGAALTPGRSLAVDKRFVPLGIPVWLDTSDPLEPGRPLRRLVIAQDTGGAIKGPVRGDLFWGFGAAAAERAGRMNVRGGYYLLLPKAIGP